MPQDYCSLAHFAQYFDHHTGEAEAFAWPGGYPIYYLAIDGEAMCPGCVTRERKLIEDAIASQSDNGWRIVGREANWENSSLYCAHCGERIPSAYAEPE